MSTSIELFPRPLQDEVVDYSSESTVGVEAGRTEQSWNEDFAREQIHNLVRQLFLPGWPKPLRQVVFSPVDSGTDVLSICIRVGDALAEQAAGSCCVAETCPLQQEQILAKGCSAHSIQKQFGTLRDSAEQLSSNLWFMSGEVFQQGHHGPMSALWLRARLAELRLEFDYTVFQGPVVSGDTAAAMLGGLCDGLVLVLAANSTRRLAAQKAKETLSCANSRLLGVVLSERTFPIPESIYQRL